MSAWTPGPWRVHGDARWSVSEVHAVNDERVARNVAPSDASLIAAAPDLYAALERATKALTEAFNAYAQGFDPMEHKAIKQAHAALAKARGETP